MSQPQWSVIAGIVVVVGLPLGFLLWSLFRHESLSDRIEGSHRERVSLDDLLAAQDERSCEEYVEQVRDCSCVHPVGGPRDSHIGDRYCPVHGIEEFRDG